MFIGNSFECIYIFFYIFFRFTRSNLFHFLLQYFVFNFRLLNPNLIKFGFGMSGAVGLFPKLNNSVQFFQNRNLMPVLYSVCYLKGECILFLQIFKPLSTIMCVFVVNYFLSCGSELTPYFTSFPFLMTKLTYIFSGLMLLISLFLLHKGYINVINIFALY